MSTGVKDLTTGRLNCATRRRNAALAIVRTRDENGNVIKGRNNEKTAIMEAVRQVEEDQQHKWMPLHDAGMFVMMDQVENAVKKFQLDENLGVKTRIRGLMGNLRSGRKVDLRGYTMSSLKELALLGQICRHPNFECEWGFYLDENKRIITHEVMSVGAPAQGSGPGHYNVRKRMSDLGAHYFVDVHNHPGGLTVFSKPGGDISVYQSLHAQLGDAFLGAVVVNTGEYSYARPDRTEIGKMHYTLSERREFTPADLGWDPQFEDEYGYGAPKAPHSFSATNPVVRPKDPLYQYNIVGSTEQELANLSRDYRKALEVSTDEEVVKQIAKIGKYLRTSDNWTTVFFVDYDNEVSAVVDYKDLHKLDKTKLYQLLRSDAARWGGVYINLYVGEGDWYKNAEDIKNSSLGELWASTEKSQKGEGNVEMMWFAGLPQEHKLHANAKKTFDSGSFTEKSKTFFSPAYFTGGDSPNLMHQGLGGEVAERAWNSEDAWQTGLTEGEPPANFANDIERTLETTDQRMSLSAMYSQLFGKDIKGEETPLEKKEGTQNRWRVRGRELGVRTFAQAVLNKLVVKKRVDPQRGGTQDAVNAPCRTASIVHAVARRDGGCRT